jgi:hypothetical protein
MPGFLDNRRGSRQAAAMTQMPFVHVSSVSLAPGSIIQPGNWGRIIERYESPIQNAPTFGNMNVVSRELVFEMVRRESFPTKPSRMEAAFCCLDEAHMQEYRKRVDPHGFHVVYRVELVEPSKATHIAPLEMSDFIVGARFLSETRNRAAIYWAGHPGGIQEVVTLSPLRILSVVN